MRLRDDRFDSLQLRNKFILNQLLLFLFKNIKNTQFGSNELSIAHSIINKRQEINEGESSIFCYFLLMFYIQKQNKMTGFEYFLLALEIVLYLLARLCDDLSWYDFGVTVEQFEGTAMAALAMSAAIMLFRKRNEQGIFKVIFVESQMKFVISWSLLILVCILFGTIFKCQDVAGDYFFVNFNGCCLNMTQIILSNFIYSMICNTRGELSKLMIYECVLFCEIIYNGKLMIMFIHSLVEQPKDLSILLISIIIANQILVMDLIYRHCYEQRGKQKKEEELEALMREIQGEKKGGDKNEEEMTHQILIKKKDMMQCEKIDSLISP